MDLHAETRPETCSTRLAARPACPRCGDRLVAPSMAAFAGEGRIWHTWSCESCDHEFLTCVDVRA